MSSEFGSGVNPIVLFFAGLFSLVIVCIFGFAIYLKIKECYERRNIKKTSQTTLPLYKYNPGYRSHHIQPRYGLYNSYNRYGNNQYWQQSHLNVRADGKVEKHGFCMTPVTGKHVLIRLDSFNK